MKKITGIGAISSNTIGENIRLQRDSINMKITDLAKKINVSRNTITNYENGKTEPSSGDLIKIAGALGCSILDILGRHETTSPRFAFRSHKELKSNPDIIVSTRKFLKAYMEIEQIIGSELDKTVCFEKYDISKVPEDKRDNYIQIYAKEIRDMSGIGNQGPEEIAHVLENLGVRCMFLKYHGKGNLDGISLLQDDIRLILLNDKDFGIERVIFTAAHELGHLVLHPDLFTSHPEKTGKDEKTYEKQAHLFAGLFLVPCDELLKIWLRDKLSNLPLEHALLILKRIFKVSVFCLFERLKKENLITMEHKEMVNRVKRLLGISGKATMADLEPEPLRSEDLFHTTRFQTLVRSAFIQEKISVTKVAEFFQITVDEAKTITAKWMVPSELVG